MSCSLMLYLIMFSGLVVAVNTSSNLQQILINLFCTVTPLHVLTSSNSRNNFKGIVKTILNEIVFTDSVLPTVNGSWHIPSLKKQTGVPCGHAQQQDVF